MKKSIVKIVSSLLNLILILSVLILSSVVIASAQSKVPSVFGYSVMRIITPSMQPEYNVNDYILVKKVDASELVVGDVISYYSIDPNIYGKPNTHKIVEINTGSGIEFTTRGIANAKVDDYTVAQDRVIGKVVGNIKLLSALSPILSNPVLLVAIILIPLIFMAILEYVTSSKNKKDKQGEE